MATAVRPVCIYSTTFLRDLHACRRRTVSVGQRRSGATRFPLSAFAGMMVEVNFSRHPESETLGCVIGWRAVGSKCKN
jgi:hypothetical protein